MKMKRSQFKALIKECLKEILQEDILMQRAVKGAMYEGMLQQPVSNVPQLPGFINPMDDQGLMLRQQVLQRQSRTQNRQLMPPGGAGAYDYGVLAGLDDGDKDPGVTRMSTNPNAKTPGTRNPLDYLSLAVEKRQVVDPRLDTPVGGGNQRQRFIPGLQPQQRMQSQKQQAPSRMVESDDIGSLSPAVLSAVFADTYSTTYAEQAAEGHIRPGHIAGGGGGMTIGGAGDRYDIAVSRSDPTELFGDAAMNWGSLAFGGK